MISGIHAYHKRDITSMSNKRFAAVRRKGEAREVKDCSPVMRHICDAGTVINKRGAVHPRNESASDEMLRLRTYDKLQNLVREGQVKKTGKKYKGVTNALLLLSERLKEFRKNGPSFCPA